MQAQDGEEPALKDLQSREGVTDHRVEEKGKKSEATVVLAVKEADKKLLLFATP